MRLNDFDPNIKVGDHGNRGGGILLGLQAGCYTGVWAGLKRDTATADPGQGDTFSGGIDI